MQTQVGSEPLQRLVLYIDDNLTNLALVEELLARRDDLRLLSSSTGHQGIVLASTRQPDVILMDINLPDISGLEAMKYLREHSATAHIPVMALSSNAFPRQIEQGMDAGFLRYLTKPFKIEEFTEALDACLNFAAANFPPPFLSSTVAAVGAHMGHTRAVPITHHKV